MQPKGSIAAGNAPGTTTSGEASASDPAAVRLQLERLLSSPHFRNSKRCQSLLHYVVNAWLEGAPDRVKERNIGCEVFHRDAGYDTNQDSVVRTTAAEVRKRLAQYYLEPGREEELRLSLPAGSYLPEFRPAAASTAATALVVEGLAPEPPSHRRVPLFWPVAALAVMTAGTLWWLASGDTALERFWKPIVDDRADAIICVEQPLKIYRIEGQRSDELNDKMVGNGPAPPAAKEVLDSTTLTLSDLKQAGNQYFSFGDLMVSVRLSELLARHKKSFQVLGDRNAAYHDLRGKPAILIGQFNNRWTLGLSGGLRYYLERNPANRMYEVHDRQDQGKVIASASRSSSRPEEYAIVSRVFNPVTEKTVISVMGMTQQGTIAGGDFLTNATYMQQAFRTAPAGWYRKNMQLVLRTAMVSGTAGPPQPVATYFW
jgi:hypothetical protein